MTIDLTKKVYPQSVQMTICTVMILWGVQICRLPITEFSSLLHNTVILFHEAGHIVFSPFGQTIMVAGGTLGQWIIPIIAAATFYFKNRDLFAMSVATWWLGASVIDASVYAFDACDPVLPLISGGTGADSFHDFIFLFERFDLMPKAARIARGMHTIGAFLMLAAIAVALWQTWLSYNLSQRDDESKSTD